MRINKRYTVLRIPLTDDQSANEQAVGNEINAWANAGCEVAHIDWQSEVCSVLMVRDQD